MAQVDEQYNDILEKILETGEWSENRTGTRTKAIFDEVLKVDLREGFPLLTSRRMPYKGEIIELEGFKNGMCSKSWYKENGCPFWNPFADRFKIPYANDPATKAKMAAEDDLGPLGYAHGWRNFGGDYDKYKLGEKTGVDQLANLVDSIREKSDNRRLIVSAWDVTNNDRAALPACHYSYTVHISPCGKYLDLKYSMRSWDVCLGWAIPKYATLMHLLANEGGLTPRFLTLHGENCHVYEDQIETAKEQLKRPIHDELPKFTLKTDQFTNIFDWTHKDYEITGYKHSGVLKYPMMAV